MIDNIIHAAFLMTTPILLPPSADWSIASPASSISASIP